MLDVLLVVGYDVDVAAAHAELLAHVRRSGTARGSHDLIITATGLATGRTIVTAEHAAFDYSQVSRCTLIGDIRIPTAGVTRGWDRFR